jgi:hypothetical protein
MKGYQDFFINRSTAYDRKAIKILHVGNFPRIHMQKRVSLNDLVLLKHTIFESSCVEKPEVYFY